MHDLKKNAHLSHLLLSNILLYKYSPIFIWPWWSSQQMLVHARDILFGKIVHYCEQIAWMALHTCWRRVILCVAVIQMWVLENRGFALFSWFVLICRALPTGSAPRTVPWHSGHTRTYKHFISHTRRDRVSNSHDITWHCSFK